ncbi:NADH:ubiquinone oxidoreductase subunit [Rhodoligotrophos appendicifer]
MLVSRHGEFVGEDELGNKYYKQRNGDRRWIVYNGEADASKIAPGWHGWMAGRTDTPPSEERYEPRYWQKPHAPNTTGVTPINVPAGSLVRGLNANAPAMDAEYEAWTPD